MFADQAAIIATNDHEHYKIAVNIHHQPTINLYFAELRKQIEEDSIRIAQDEERLAKGPAQPPATTDIIDKELTGFWAIKFGQSPETVASTLKNTKKYTPSNHKTRGKIASLRYENCMFGSDQCKRVVLAFYNGKLCAGRFTIACDADRIKEIIKAMEDKYAPAKQYLETDGLWTFKDGNGIFIKQEDAETATVLYTRNKEFDLFTEEINKTKTADY